jgi:hypothetical protein
MIATFSIFFLSRKKERLEAEAARLAAAQAMERAAGEAEEKGSPSQSSSGNREGQQSAGWPGRSALFCLPLLLPLSQQRKPPALLLLSWLNTAAFVFAVYASQTLSPRPMQDSLPVTGQVFPGGVRRVVPPGGSTRSCCKVLPVSSFHELS